MFFFCLFSHIQTRRLEILTDNSIVSDPSKKKIQLAFTFVFFLPQFSSHPCDLCFLSVNQEIKEKRFILNYELKHTVGIN